MNERKQAWANNFGGKHIRSQVGPDDRQLLLFGGNGLGVSLDGAGSATEVGEQSSEAAAGGRDAQGDAQTPADPQPVSIAPEVVSDVWDSVRKEFVDQRFPQIERLLRPEVQEQQEQRHCLPKWPVGQQANDDAVTDEAVSEAERIEETAKAEPESLGVAAPTSTAVATEEPQSPLETIVSTEVPESAPVARVKGLAAMPPMGLIERVEFLLVAWIERMRQGKELVASPLMHAVNHGAMVIGSAHQRRPLQDVGDGASWAAAERSTLVSLTVDAAVEWINGSPLFAKVDMNRCFVALTAICKAMQPEREKEFDALLKAAMQRLEDARKDKSGGDHPSSPRKSKGRKNEGET